MEFNLLKHITTPIGFFIPNLHVIQSPFQATDFVNPGLGNANKKYNGPFVPIYSRLPTYTSNKVKSESSPALEQKGFGEPAAKPADEPAAEPTKKEEQLEEETLQSEMHPVNKIEKLNNGKQPLSRAAMKRKIVDDEAADDFYQYFSKPKVSTTILKQYVKQEAASTLAQDKNSKSLSAPVAAPGAPGSKKASSGPRKSSKAYGADYGGFKLY